MAAKFSQNWNKWIDKVLKGTHNHYSCYLPKKLGVVVTLILRLFYSGIKTDKGQTDVLQQLQDDAVIVYATKFKSYFEYRVEGSWGRSGFETYPQIGFDYSVFLWQPLSRQQRTHVAPFDFFVRKRTLPDPYGSGYIGQPLLDI